MIRELYLKINSFTISHKFLLFYGTKVYFTMFTRKKRQLELSLSIKILYPFSNTNFYVIFPSCLLHLDVLIGSVYFLIFDAANLFFLSHVWVNLQFKNNISCEMFTLTYQWDDNDVPVAHALTHFEWCPTVVQINLILPSEDNSCSSTKNVFFYVSRGTSALKEANQFVK